MSRPELARALLPPSVFVVTAAVLLRDGSWLHRLGAGLEAAVYLAAFFLLLSRRPVREQLGALPRPHRAVLAVLFGLVLAGHFAHDTRRTFPFSAWTMYASVESPDVLVFYRPEGIDFAQSRVAMDDARLFPALGGSSIASRMRELATLTLARSDRTGDAPQRLTELLRAIGEAHNRSHPDQALRVVELVQYSLNLRDQGKSGLSSRPVFEVALGERAE